ncbi:hypothetical protein RclHR1_14640005 [Rhizophagus clarus]|uniref:F-box domain-containing protein n=1 Tax=Rhizophagus clarus TaxID=94130 RepID=A0A2Z6QD95_9GLOM|nr:hypothetical protein RclHR1_14640005 [Rhizophagus clarus]GET04806.1 hypothetical protein GLOIN_2v1764020 [Rhizophagus clarus]
MVNRLWCETVVPILWRNPWSYDGVNYNNKSSLFTIISCYLFDNIKGFITEQGIQLPSSSNQSLLLFDYLSFCRSINVNTIRSIISIGSTLDYNQFSMQQEFYSLFMKKCPELKYFDMRSIKHQIFYFPEAKARLELLCELKCDTSIDSSYLYGLSQLCHHIQRIIIINIDQKPNYGIAKLIEVQKNLIHFEWDDYDEYLTDDPYKDIFLALVKKSDTLHYLKVFFDGIDNTTLQDILPKFHKLKTLISDGYFFLTKEQLERLKKQVYHDLEILNLEWNSLNVISCIIENNGGRLKKILFRPHDTIDCDYYHFNEHSLNFIRKVHENCPLIEYLSIIFPPSKEHFTEFENLLKVCKNLKSLLLLLDMDITDTYDEVLEHGKELLNMLIRSSSTSLIEVRLCNRFKFSLKILEEFLEKWRVNRPILSIYTIDSTYKEEDYKELINKYKNDGVIKDFKHVTYMDEICYNEIS